MKYSEGQIGRIFVLRLEEGERLPEVIEDFAEKHDIARAMVLYVGGAQDGSRLVVGPEAGRGSEIIPMIHALEGIQEVLGAGTHFPRRNREAGPPHARRRRSGRRGHRGLHPSRSRGVACGRGRPARNPGSSRTAQEERTERTQTPRPCATRLAGLPFYRSATGLFSLTKTQAASFLTISPLYF